MTLRSALIIFGGWDGHQPKRFAECFASQLQKHQFTVQVEDSLESLEDAAALEQHALILPCWTCGELSATQWKNLEQAVRSGIGIAGTHGGMGDAFRGNLDYEWMVGGHFVGHPHVGTYTVDLTDRISPITEGMSRSFSYNSEQYYMMMDPAVEVLADTVYEHAGRSCRMPVVWTKTWGKGRVFYSALGHDPQELIDYPHVLEMTVRGLLWAAK